MSTVTIFGKGNMGTAIKSVFEDAGATVQALDSHDENPTIQGDIVVLAVPYPALASIAKQYGDQLAGKTVIDITNPLDFSTFDSLVVPADSSAAAELQKLLPPVPRAQGIQYRVCRQHRLQEDGRRAVHRARCRRRRKRKGRIHRPG